MGSQSSKRGPGDGPRTVNGLIVGAGPSGLSVAYALQGDAVVLEKNDQVGGLCRSIEHDGGVFDIGGHSFHTPHSEVRELVEQLVPEGLFYQKREARVYSHGSMIPYPFQKHFDQIADPEVVKECQDGLQAVADTDPADAADFEEYIVKKFGPGIAQHFMLPYNRKLWARDISKISCEWTSERVASAKGEEEKFEKEGGKRKPLQSDTYVGYPRDGGGYQRIYECLAEHVPEVRLNQEVVEIDPSSRTVRTEDGHRYRWDFLVNTMPLPVLLRRIEGAPAALIEQADRLEYMSLRVELLLAGRRLDTEIQRIYAADPDIPPHKTALNHNSSQTLRERDRHAIMAEVSLSPEKPVEVDAIAPRTIEWLCDLGILDSPDDVIWQGHVDVEHAYPVYTHQRPGIVGEIKDWLSERDIFTLGRFGEWKYINSDKCLHQGLQLGEQLRHRYGLSAPSAPQGAGAIRAGD